MKKCPLIGICIIAVVVLILGSLSNVVGFQTVQSSNQNAIKNEVNQKELLFQTIVDITNNKQIQRIILKSQISRQGFFNPDVKLSAFNTQVFTKNQLKHMYIIGLMLSKIISKPKIHSMVEQYQLNNQDIQKEINAVIEKDTILNGEMNQLSNSDCDCENDNTTQWSFPVICLLLVPFLILAIAFYVMFGFGFLGEIMGTIGGALHCSWY